MRIKKNKLNQKGQGLVEYLIIVSIVGIATIGIMKIVGANINVQFGNIARALGGSTQQIQSHEVQDSVRNKKDLGNFLDGAK